MFVMYSFRCHPLRLRSPFLSHTKIKLMLTQIPGTTERGRYNEIENVLNVIVVIIIVIIIIIIIIIVIIIIIIIIIITIIITVHEPLYFCC